MPSETTLTVGNYVNVIGELQQYMKTGGEGFTKAVEITKETGPVAVDTHRGVIEAIPGDFVEHDGRSLAVWSPGEFHKEFIVLYDRDKYES